MGRLDYLKQFKQACEAGPAAAGFYTSTSGWESGIPGDASKQMDRAHYSQVGTGPGAVITVWGSMRNRFDSSTPTFDITVPVTNGNIFTAVSGTMKKHGSSQQLTLGLNLFAGPGTSTTKVGVSGTGIADTPNETWDFKFSYTLT